MLVGYGVGATFGTPTAAAGSIDTITFELRGIRRAVENIGRNCR